MSQRSGTGQSQGQTWGRDTMGIVGDGVEEKWRPWCYVAFLQGTVHLVVSGALEWSVHNGSYQPRSKRCSPAVNMRGLMEHLCEHLGQAQWGTS